MNRHTETSIWITPRNEVDSGGNWDNKMSHVNLIYLYHVLFYIPVTKLDNVAMVWSNQYSDVTVASWRFEWPANRLLVHQRVQAINKRNINLRITGIFWKESTGDRWFPSQKSINVWFVYGSWHQHGISSAYPLGAYLTRHIPGTLWKGI